MHSSEKNFEKIVGNYPRGRQKKETDSLDKYFENPIIHRQILGDKIYVKLDLKRIWDQLS